MALWTLFETTRVSQYQKVHFAIFWIFWYKMKIMQADAPTIWMDCHPIQTNWCPHLYHPHHFYAGCSSWHNPPNLSWLGTGTKYAGFHTRWLGGKTRKVKPIWIYWHLLGYMQIWPDPRQITMPSPHHSSFLQAGCPSCRPTNSIKALRQFFYFLVRSVTSYILQCVDTIGWAAGRASSL